MLYYTVSTLHFGMLYINITFDFPVILSTLSPLYMVEYNTFFWYIQYQSLPAGKLKCARPDGSSLIVGKNAGTSLPLPLIIPTRIAPFCLRFRLSAVLVY